MIKDILKEIGIVREGSLTKNGSYTIDIEDSDDFGRFYSILDKSSKVEEMEDNAINNVHTISLVYLYKDILINLTADFDGDKYTLIAKEINRDEFEDEEDIEDEEEEEVEKE